MILRALATAPRPRRVIALRSLAAGLSAVVLLLAGCGGSDSNTASDVVPPAPAPTSTSDLSIATFSPTTGGAGAAVNVTGAGFTALQSVRVGSAAAPFTVQSDTQLQLTVPAGAQTGRIELAAPGRTVLSANDFTVSLVPTLTSVSPSTVLPGARVTLNGTNLDRVTQVRINSTVLPIVTQSVSVITVDVPAATPSGPLTLVEASGTRLQAQRLTVVAAMTVTSFSPASIVTGRTLTINGTGLNRAMTVAFASGATAPVATRTGSTRITVTVPDAATSGVVRVRGNAADEVASAAPLTVIPAIRVNSTTVYRVASPGSSVTITGTGLTEVTAVTVQGVAAAIVSQAATQLVFTVPSGTACGAISLRSASQPSVLGGSVIVGAGCTATLAGIEFGQVLGQAATDGRQRLVPGKETWVRAYVVSDQTGLVSPTVRVTGYRGVTILGTLAMTGPAMLPTSAGLNVPDSVRYSEAQSFNAQLPAAWVASGLSVRVEVDPEQRYGPVTTTDATPNVGTSTHLEIVLVPVVSGGFVPTVPTTAEVLDELTRRFPIPRDRIAVTQRASYTLSSVANGIDTSTDWTNALSELRQLRDSENRSNPYRYYFGFVRRSSGGIAGIGYVPGRAALGWDSASGWKRTMSHELGHNFGRPHAPCGGPSSPDPSYPYSGGVLGASPLVDSVPSVLDVISPVNQTDIMGYCSGAWFSDYNYRLLQSHLESQPQSMLTLAQDSTSPVELLLLSGRIGVDGVTLRPAHALRGAVPSSEGEYSIRMITRDGRTIDHAFDTEEVDHAEPPERHFSFAMPNPGAIDRIEVRHGNTIIPVNTALARAQRSGTRSAEPLTIDWREGAGQLTIAWNGRDASPVSVTHIGADGERTVLALQRRGGALTVDTSGLSAGGVFEVSVSEGLGAQRLTLGR